MTPAAQTKARFVPLPPSTLDPEGKRLCRWCKAPVPKGRLKWCGQACVHEYKIRADGNYIREQLMRRDKGVCAACGLDTLALGNRAIEARKRGYTEYLELLGQYPGLRLPHYRVASNGRGGWWQADHIVEVVRGGGGCGIENLQTLCCACHKAKTKRLVGELAAQRRNALAPAKELELF